MNDADVLLSRVVDREATPDDWRDLDALARVDGETWPRLAALLRDEAELRCAVVEHVSRADAVDVPAGVARHDGGSTLLTWSGWIAAAALLLAWWTSSTSTDIPPLPSPSTAGMTTEAAGIVVNDGGTGLDAGRPEVLHELGKVLVETRPTPDGAGLEVLYIRRSLEREVVDGAYRIVEDEAGRLRPIPVSLSDLAPADIL